VYISLDIEGKPTVQALPYNRRGQKIGLEKNGETKKGSVELRSGFSSDYRR
jgi:hypothetical protein